MKLKYFSYEDIKSWSPCYDPIRYISRDWKGTVLDILNLDNISFEDRLWAVLRTELISEKIMRLFAVWSYRQTLKFIKNPDSRSIHAANIAEAYALGKATKQEMLDAWSAAWSASSAAWSAESAAWSAESAAWSAGWSAARSAGWSAARSAESAARSAAWSAAWSASSAAWSAESAAWSAESAARSAGWSAARSAESAARSAAWSAGWSAARSAESAARSAAESIQKDKLIEMIKEEVKEKE